MFPATPALHDPLGVSAPAAPPADTLYADSAPHDPVAARLARLLRARCKAAGTPLPTTILQHHIRAGDSLATLALRYSTSALAIKRANQLWDDAGLRARHIIIIPLYPPPRPASLCSVASSSATLFSSSPLGQ